MFLIEDDSIYMRIELLKADVSWDEVEKNVQAQLKGISETIRDPSLISKAVQDLKWKMGMMSSLPYCSRMKKHPSA
ncbi:hypothetical protein Q5O89_13710 [Peribacillus frigoritolerans]|nr:hypothetical protein [Peribacillus frigoritolerans]